MQVYGELIKAGAENLAADPAGVDLFAGRIWYNSADGVFRGYNGTSIIEFGDTTTEQNFENVLLTGSEVTDFSQFAQQTDTPSLPPAGQTRIYPKTDGRFYLLDSEGNETPLGSGSGSGAKNYIDELSSNIENTTGDWQAGAGLTLSTTDVAGEFLVGASSLKISKDADDRGGELVSISTTTIDPADRGRVLYGSLEFNPIAGYESGDFIIEAYDVTNSAILYSGVAADLEILNAKGKAYWITHTEDTTEQIELRLKVNTVSATAFDVVIDDIKFGPATVIPGTPTNTVVTKFLSSDITSADEGNVISDLTFTGLVVGKRYEIRGQFGFTVAQNGTPDNIDVVAQQNGVTVARTIAAAEFSGGVAFIIASMNQTFVATDTTLVFRGFSINVNSRIVGGQGTDRTFVELERRYNLDAPGAVTTNTLSTSSAMMTAVTNTTLTHAVSGQWETIIYPVAFKDSHSGYNGTTGEYTCPAKGRVFSTSTAGFNANATGSRLMRIVRNGNPERVLFSSETVASTQMYFNGTGILEVEKGDVLEIQGWQNSGGSLNYVSATMFWDLAYLPDLTVMGVVRNDEFLISENIIQNILPVQPINTWFDLDPGWFLDVPEGEWILDAAAFLGVSSVNTNATVYATTVLSTSATASGITLANIVAFNKGIAAGNGADANFRQARWQHVGVHTEKFVTSGERLKMYAFSGNLSGATQAQITLRNDVGNALGKGFISARRLK